MKAVTGLQYSCCNEDGRSELEALDLSGRRVLTVAAAGERAFGLLLGDPREVVAIDRNPVQVYLGQLKVAAMRHLERDAYLAFVGIRESTTRAATYRKIRDTVPAEARSYWDGHSGDIAEGVHSVGRTERGIARIAPLLRRVLAADIARLRACATVEEQSLVVGALVRRPLVRAALALIFNPISGRFVLRDPVYYGEARRPAASYLLDRVRTTLENHRFDDCFILSLFLHGHLKDSPSLSIDLAEDTYSLVRERLDRVRFEASCISEYLARQPAGSFDAFSLADLGGYLTVDEFSLLLDRVQHVASAEATVCIREYISTPTTVARWPSTLLRRRELEDRLARSDRSVGCTFVCAAKSTAAVAAV